jgi:hypothetical protein
MLRALSSASLDEGPSKRPGLQALIAVVHGTLQGQAAGPCRAHQPGRLRGRRPAYQDWMLLSLITTATFTEDNKQRGAVVVLGADTHGFFFSAPQCSGK